MKEGLLYGRIPCAGWRFGWMEGLVNRDVRGCVVGVDFGGGDGEGGVSY